MEATVALRKESVDRNCTQMQSPAVAQGSLSARRAWIEISTRAQAATQARPSLSARRAWIEIDILQPGHVPRLSLSARRAWIEISKHLDVVSGWVVALRKESVDRNDALDQPLLAGARRSPQGERG